MKLNLNVAATKDNKKDKHNKNFLCLILNIEFSKYKSIRHKKDSAVRAEATNDGLAEIPKNKNIGDEAKARRKYLKLSLRRFL